MDENQMQLTVNPAQTVGSVTEEGGEEDGQAAHQVLWMKEGVRGWGVGRYTFPMAHLHGLKWFRSALAQVPGGPTAW